MSSWVHTHTPLTVPDPSRTHARVSLAGTRFFLPAWPATAVLTALPAFAQRPPWPAGRPAQPRAAIAIASQGERAKVRFRHVPIRAREERDGSRSGSESSPHAPISQSLRPRQRYLARPSIVFEMGESNCLQTDEAGRIRLKGLPSCHDDPAFAVHEEDDRMLEREIGRSAKTLGRVRDALSTMNKDHGPSLVLGTSVTFAASSLVRNRASN